MAASGEARGVERLLEAAAISRSRCGLQRTARLSGAESAFYRWVIKRLAFAIPPTAAELAEQARVLALDLSFVLAALAREDLVHTDQRGAVMVAYLFSARARGHEVVIEGRVVQAMCAIDALGIGSSCGDGPSFCGCCEVLKLFRVDQ